MKLIGTCHSDLRGFQGRAVIECDPDNQQITIFFLVSDPYRFMGAARESLLKQPVKVRNIELVSRTSRFRIAKLPPAFLSSVGVGGWSIDDGQIDTLLNLNNNDTGLVKLAISLKSGELPLHIISGPPMEHLTEELVLTNHGRYMNERFPLDIGNKTYQVRYGAKRVFIRGRITQIDREVFRHTCSLLTLAAQSMIAHLRPPRLVLNMYVPQIKAHREQVVSKAALQSSFQHIAVSLSEATDTERQRTFNEITYIASAFGESGLLEERVTSLFKALESFDGCRTLTAQRCATLLGLNRADARFVCEVRNKIIHNAMTLMDAAIEAHTRVTSRRSDSLNRFAPVRRQRDLPWKLYVTIARLITSSFFRHLGVKEHPRVFPSHKAY